MPFVREPRKLPVILSPACEATAISPAVHFRSSFWRPAMRLSPRLREQLDDAQDERRRVGRPQVGVVGRLRGRRLLPQRRCAGEQLLDLAQLVPEPASSSIPLLPDFCLPKCRGDWRQ